METSGRWKAENMIMIMFYGADAVAAAAATGIDEWTALRVCVCVYQSSDIEPF